MNNNFILANLKEARDAMIQIIQTLESDREYDYGNYLVDMTHLYHHINTAWNARDISEDKARECAEENWFKWRQFPSKNEIYLGP